MAHFYERAKEVEVHILEGPVSHTQPPGSPGAPKWPPREKQLWNLAVEARPLLDTGGMFPSVACLVLSSPTLILPKGAEHPQYTKMGLNRREENPGEDKERGHWVWRKETGLRIRPMVKPSSITVPWFSYSTSLNLSLLTYRIALIPVSTLWGGKD